MSKEHLRNDNECANCGYTVDIEYCSKCGQKNTETRQPFHHLFTHFIEDLTHYDGAFWKTIKHLMFRPGRLTIEYLQGKRQTYVPPVKLYIFISFVTFFIISIMPVEDDEKNIKVNGTEAVDEEDVEIINGRTFTSVAELEKYQDSLPEDQKINKIDYYVNKASLRANEKNISDSMMIDAFANTLPKVLFLYMPIFAFWLWLFHGKKRWYFFDHGIFTLHYFSFLLISVTLYLLLIAAMDLFENKAIKVTVVALTGLAVAFYSFFYFFRSHRRMYGENKWISRLKSLILFFLNFFIINFLLFAAFFYALLTIH